MSCFSIRKLLAVGWLAAALAVACGGALDSAASAAEAPLPSKLADLDLSLTVQEPAGVERRSEVCSTGVPLPLGLIQEPEGIALFDDKGAAVPAQFRVLERWRNFGEDKSIKWLLVTFFADVPKDGKTVYHLKAGKNPAPAKPVKIEEKGDAYEMGGQVIKKDFSAPFKLVLTDPDGKELTAADVPVTWSVWESGPVRACLKAETPTVPDKFGFIAWVYAYAGQDRWDMTVVLKNTPRKFRGPFYFKDFSVVWEPAELKGAKDFLFGGEAGKAASGQLAGQGAYLYQASSGTDKWNDKACLQGLGGATPEFRGYKAFAGEKQIAGGDAALGWAALNGQDKGALVCTRFFRPQYPKAVEVEPGRITVRLWPRQWKSHGGLHWLDDMSRKAYDVSFRLASGAVKAGDGDNAARTWDSFLVARAPVECYAGRSAEPSMGVPSYLTKSCEEALATGGWVLFGSRQIQAFKFHYHGGSLDPYANSGLQAAADALFVRARVASGMVPLWLDDYQYPRDAKELKHGHYCFPLRDPYPWVGYRPGTGHHGWMPWNHAHFFCGELFDGWRLFGDPMALEAVKGVGTYCQSFVDYREGPKWKENIPRAWANNGISCQAAWEGGGVLSAGSRAEGMPLYNLCQAYSITGDESMMQSLRRFAAVSWRQVDKERGVYAPNDTSSERKTPKGTLSEDSGFMGQVMDGLLAYYLLTHDETTADEITGILDWVINETTVGAGGHMTHIPLSNGEVYANMRKGYLDKQLGHFQIDPGIYAFAYGYTGEARYQDGLTAWEAGKKRGSFWGGFCNLHYRDETLIPGLLKDPRRGRAPEAVKDLAAEATGGGKVKLTWTAPQGSPARYQVKWAEKKIVDCLRFNVEKQTFELDPKEHANWWAANNVEGEPKPGASGAKEMMTVEGVAPGKRFFAVRSFDAVSNRSALSNIVEMEVK